MDDVIKLTLRIIGNYFWMCTLVEKRKKVYLKYFITRYFILGTWVCDL
jgi:hypothetical protein